MFLFKYINNSFINGYKYNIPCFTRFSKYVKYIMIKSKLIMPINGMKYWQDI